MGLISTITRLFCKKTVANNITLPKATVADSFFYNVWDKVSQERIETLHPKVRQKAIEFINQVERRLKIQLRVTSALRTWDEQNELFAQGRTKSGKIVTNVRGGFSNHNFGLAIDVVPIVNGKADYETNKWDEIAKIGKEIGFDWGGDWKSFKDRPHFEMTFGKTTRELRSLYLFGKRDGEYIYLND
jgi:peptidoglycan L-alanyl-D-glutamate endopeptidase CwlK